MGETGGRKQKRGGEMRYDEPRDWLEPLLARNLEWVRAADAKITPILAIDTAMLGVLAALVPSVGDWSVLDAVSAAIATLLLLASLTCLVIASFPRLSGPRGSLVYFDGIASHESNAYVEKIVNISANELTRDYASQVHRNAEIAAAKFRSVKYSMIALFVSVPPWLVSVALLYSDGG